jgi:multiple sugar transport system substrate-binding protein
MKTSGRTQPLLGSAIAATMSVGLVLGSGMALAQDTSIDLSKWSPEYVRSIAGTATFDTAGDCSKVVPLDYKGRLTVWCVRHQRQWDI